MLDLIRMALYIVNGVGVFVSGMTAWQYFWMESPEKASGSLLQVAVFSACMILAWRFLRRKDEVKEDEEEPDDGRDHG